jgi:hypothetical protein
MGLSERAVLPAQRLRPARRSRWERSLWAVRGASLQRQIVWGLAAYFVLFTLLVAFGINGSSSSLLYGSFHPGTDPGLIAGQPRPIRSDEWLVVTPLIISQVQNGLPAVSDIFPGGMDASIVWDLPYRDWSVLLRPHMWGFFALPLDNAFAFKWWLPFFVLTAAGYVLLTVLWRRPLAAFAVAGLFAVSPFMQWWFLPNTFWPPAAALAACAAVLVLLDHPHGWWRWPVGVGTAYLVALAVITLYPPFLIPCIIAAVGFAFGAVLSKRELSWRERLRRLIPLAVGAVAACVVTAIFLAQRSATVHKVLSTVYPGQRLTPTGTGVPWLSTFAGVFGQGLRASDQTGFSGNSSEGSSFLFLGMYLIPVVIWLLVRQWRRGQTDWLLLGTVLSLATLLAFVYVPGWDVVAHILLLDRTTATRSLVGIGVSSMLLLGLVVHRLAAERRRAPWWIVVAVVVLVVAQHLAVLGELQRHAPQVLAVVGEWPVMLVLLTGALVLFARSRPLPAALLAAVVALMVAGWVNPIHRGVVDLRSTNIGEAIAQTEKAHPGAWVGVGGADVMAVLRESGVEAYSGVQPYPSAEMWKDLDPTSSNVAAWNRYAHVNWTLSPDAPEITVPQADVLLLRFDSCAAFEQRYVKYVLTAQPVQQGCVRLVRSIPESGTSFYIYAVSSGAH